MIFRVSYIKSIDVWMFTCMVFVFGALIEYSAVNVLARRRKVRALCGVNVLVRRRKGRVLCDGNFDLVKANVESASWQVD